MDMMEHKHKGGTGWIITLVILVALLIIVGMVAPKIAGRPGMNQDAAQDQEMNQSDDLESINADIDSSLETDMQTENLGY